MTNRKQGQIDEDAISREAPRQFIIGCQPNLRRGATRLGNFKRCQLPKCRRAKQCLGCHPIDEINADDFKRFPPCVDTNDRHMSLMKCLREMDAEAVAALIAAGHLPEDLERQAEADHDTMWEAARVAALKELRVRAGLGK